VDVANIAYRRYLRCRCYLPTARALPTDITYQRYLCYVVLETRGACNRQAAGQRTLAPFCSAYSWLITWTEAIRLKRSITKTADDINIAHSDNKHAQLTQLLNLSNLLQHVNRNKDKVATNLQQLRNNMYYHSSHGSRHFVLKPKSHSKIRLLRWPALLETRASRLPTKRYARLANYTHPNSKPPPAYLPSGTLNSTIPYHSRVSSQSFSDGRVYTSGIPTAKIEYIPSGIRRLKIDISRREVDCYLWCHLPNMV